MNEAINFLMKKSKEFQELKKTSKNPQQVEHIIRTYKEELRQMGVSTLDNWFS